MVIYKEVFHLWPLREHSCLSGHRAVVFVGLKSTHLLLEIQIVWWLLPSTSEGAAEHQLLEKYRRDPMKNCPDRAVLNACMKLCSLSRVHMLTLFVDQSTQKPIGVSVIKPTHVCAARSLLARRDKFL